MSNINTAICTSDTQLFTELTSEEGAVIEGGATLLLYRLTALNASDFNGDEIYIKVNGETLIPPGIVPDVDSGETININRAINFNGTAKLELFDDDVWGNSDDYLGGFSVGSTPTNGITSNIIRGSASYRILYQVIA
ncbi:hypothetical protein F7734_38035 [Scytonema sp. UIC 10036]|uniref:hypothetical protein n=1 Tax=Scytonema sp. UIC 10036 TaxID=2304196 RepID=UPI0012DAA2FA|nr:hypothetical protein [Scytonema sp. UIC 10036]MUG97800.1 hypothetical protein [Scytonema sp. UIC 10036]